MNIPQNILNWLIEEYKRMEGGFTVDETFKGLITVCFTLGWDDGLLGYVKINHWKSLHPLIPKESTEGLSDFYSCYILDYIIDNSIEYAKFKQKIADFENLVNLMAKTYSDFKSKDFYDGKYKVDKVDNPHLGRNDIKLVDAIKILVDKFEEALKVGCNDIKLVGAIKILVDKFVKEHSDKQVWQVFNGIGQLALYIQEIMTDRAMQAFEEALKDEKINE